VSALEFRKLRAEAEKAELDLLQVRRATRTHVLSTIVPLITTLLAVAGLVITVVMTTRQMSLQAGLSAEQRFSESIREFAAVETSLARLGALESLKPYWRDPAYHQRVTELLLGSIAEIEDRNVRQAITEFFLSTPTSETIGSLADHNRAIQAYARETGIDLSIPWYPSTDSLKESLYRRFDSELGWNIATLTGALRRMQGKSPITGLDLSRVILGRQYWTPGQGLHIKDTVFFYFTTFKDVDFSGATLSGVHFWSVDFQHSKMDETRLIRTTFHDCDFQEVSMKKFEYAPPLASIRRFASDTLFSDASYAPLWQHSKLSFVYFYPAYNPELRKQTIFRFRNTSWTIEASWPEMSFPPSGSNRSIDYYNEDLLRGRARIDSIGRRIPGLFLR
jgi:uncharacterized protein YjbI with pentapeptide repeats